MKHQILKTIFLCVSLILQSCSKEDDGPRVAVPNVSFTNTQISATFFQAGASEAPEINWNGEQGSVTITPAIEGLSVDNQTGQLSWTNMLAPTQHNFQLVAANSAGQSITDFTIDNYLEGEFVGTYSTNGNSSEFYFKITFYPNGAMSATTDSTNWNTPASGGWQHLPTDYWLTNYTYPSGGDFSTIGLIDHTPNAVTYSGSWHDGFNGIQANEVGTFSVVLD